LAKSSQENAPKNLRDLVLSACKQINRATCDKGVVVLNLKNVLQHEDLQMVSFPDWKSAAAALEKQVNLIRSAFWRDEADSVASYFSAKGNIAPVALLVAQSTVNCYPDGDEKLTPTQIKSMKLMTLPREFDPASNSFATEVKSLASDVNRRGQREL
jgi:hypothetical protein